MLLRLFALVSVLMLAEPGLSASTKPQPPSLDHVVRLVGRYGIAHACPIAPTTALTNAHVVDLRPFDPSVPLYPHRFETVDGQQIGLAVAERVSQGEDLALIQLSREVPYYPIATNAPEKGDTLYWAGYDWSKRKRFGDSLLMQGRVVNLIAGSIVIDTETMSGSSGGCVLNADGEVVGVVAWGLSDESGGEVTIAVGVWGPWFAAPEKQP